MRHTCPESTRHAPNILVTLTSSIESHARSGRQGIARRATTFAALFLLFVASACDSLDPTGQFFSIRFKNDLSQRADFTECDHSDCRDLTQEKPLTAGDVAGAPLSPGESAIDLISDRDVTTSWLVTSTPSRAILGCIVLRFDGRYKNVVVRLSQMQPCATARPLGLSDVAHGARALGLT